MTIFVIVALILVVATLALLLQPFYRRSASADVSQQELNTAIYRDQFAELERDLAEGKLAHDEYALAHAELQRRLIEDSDAVAANSGASVSAPSLNVATGVAVSLPLLAVLLYLLIGNPAGLRPPVAAEQQFSPHDIEVMVSSLADRLEQNPNNPEGWVMLGRSYRHLGRIPDAVRAYERAAALNFSNADFYIEYADTLAGVEGFSVNVRNLIDKALQLNPNHNIGLWLRGTVAYRNNEYQKAIDDWEKLLALLPPESDDAGVLRANITETRSRLQQAGNSGTVR